jgi:hypothetical protein
MTTITTTDLRRSTPHRTRRYVIAALATAGAPRADRGRRQPKQ